MRKAAIPVLTMFACCVAHSQTFDAASIRPAPPLRPNSQGRIILPRPSGGPGTQDPGRIHYPYKSLMDLLATAFGVKTFQIEGPAWLDTERFDVTATMPPDTGEEQFQTMLRNLLAERFQMKFHRATKELPIFSLVVAKGGPKLKESTEAPAGDVDPATMPPPGKVGSDGFPVLLVPAGAPIVIIMTHRGARMAGKQKTMIELADRLTGLTPHPVFDATGLKGEYDFTLTFATEGLNGPQPPPAPGGVSGAPPAAAPEAEPFPDIYAAIQAQLGLKLDPKKGPVGMIVIDHIEKTPTEN